MKYRQLIFDASDTLIDFAATEDSSLHALFKPHKLPFSSDLRKQYHTYNQGLWCGLELGGITCDELSEMTLHDFIKGYFNLGVDGNEWMNEYRFYSGEVYQLLPGVEDTLRLAKKQGYKLTVLNNGEKFMQRHRLELTGIKDYFDLIATSEEARHFKPDPYASDYFFNRTETGPNETSFFGDGLQSDILGAEKYGFDSIQYNHRHRRDIIGLHPLSEVETYPEFVKIMQNDFQKTY